MPATHPRYPSRIRAGIGSGGLTGRPPAAAGGRRPGIRRSDHARAVAPAPDAPPAPQTQAKLAGPRAGRAPRPGDMGWVVQRNAAVYAEEFGWDDSYEALVARIVADYVETRDPDAEAAWIAEVDGAPAGCVFCVREDASTARLRLLLVEPWARGLGIGGRLVDEVLRFARGAGYTRITLWTNDVLADARRIYQRAGFILDDESPHHRFGKDLTGQNWSRDL